MATLDMFPDAPKSKRVKRAFIFDVDGQCCCDREGPHLVMWGCRCGWRSGWVTSNLSIAKERRGIPCPTCNEAAK